MQKFIVAAEHNGLLVGDYLTEIQNYSRRGLRNAEVYLNGKKTRLDKKIKDLKKPNRIIVVEKKKETGIVPMEMDLKVVYEDRNLLILDKPPYIIVHPTQKKVDKTLANGVVAYFQKIGLNTDIPRFYNRLDMNTSGLIVIAKNAYAQCFLQEQGDVQKKYMAIVKGIIPWDEKTIERPIGRVGDELRRIELEESEGGQKAKTFIKVIKRCESKDLTLVEAELFTGRTHQIRAHMSMEGYPILGDELYGGEDKRAKRQLLHSYKLAFKDPENKNSEELKKISVEIDIPDDMKEIVE